MLELLAARSGPRPGCPTGERALWTALSQRLPAGWYAWHSMRLRTRGGVEAEGDFVLGVPGRGALVIEVKSGAIDVAGGTWLQNGRRRRPSSSRRRRATCATRCSGSTIWSTSTRR